jgi:iron complex outermembrane receptor protein
VFSSFISGDLTNAGVKFPSAKEGLKVVFGAEYRRDHLVTHPDAELETGDLAGNGSPNPPVEGGNHVWEGFAEARLPIAKDVTGAKSLDLDAGYRYSSYSVGFTTNTYKFGVQWAPVSDVRLRGSYNRSARVPNLQELYNPPHVGLDGGNDPCSTQSNGSAGAGPCSWGNPGVPGNVNFPVTESPAGQYNGIIGGNVKLTPEIGTTWEYGIVFTPTAVPNFNVTIDYSDIKITNLVNSYGSNTILNNCYNGPGNGTFFCNLIHRDQAGTIWASPQGYVIDPLINEGTVENKSIDVGVAYKIRMGKAGDLRARLDGTYLQSLRYTPDATTGAAPYDCAGFFGPSCAPATPKWRHNFRLDWDTPMDGLSAGIAWRFFGSTKNSTVYTGVPSDYYGDPTAAGIVPDARIPSYSYRDLHASYQVEKVTFRLGINNVLDKSPPLVDCSDSGGNSIYCESNTYPSMYESIGRYVFLNITADF